ncbi:hypothetical protein FHL15_005957 [Xylaria flabelliformis]|uniref:Cut9 interacting protein Scn1 n=1 Tax=Xylaria flabelliformis TaxID=2512241 RepID=A0A553HYQ7_9PEZI|nr:hypothetical protein FHL15_005957 [Xylaria flabelliformis]
MCLQHSEGDTESSTPQNSSAGLAQNVSEDHREPFPWDAGVFDAHCHPTDTMASIKSIPAMKARVLTVMSTRSQDQELVCEVAWNHGLHDGKTLLSPSLLSTDQDRIVPSFGWHPWFSYQLYDDKASSPTYDGTPAGKIAHYDQVLAPAPSSKDVSFSNGLSEPRPLSEFLEETRRRLEKFPLALVGEVGLDKVFRLPTTWTSAEEEGREEGLTPGGREGRRLSPYRVQMAHQATILRAQLELAGRMGRAVSVHGVQAHGILYDTIASCWKGHEKEVLSRRQKRQIATGAEDFSDDTDDDSVHDITLDKGDNLPKPTADSGKKVGPRNFPPRICLHSYSGHVEQLKMYIHPRVPAKVYFSFSMAINWDTGGGEKTEEAIRAIPDDRLLVESDLHVAGEQMDSSLAEVCRQICHIKGWSLREGVEILGKNWREFVLGS